MDNQVDIPVPPIIVLIDGGTQGIAKRAIECNINSKARHRGESGTRYRLSCDGEKTLCLRCR